ncbi:protein ETHYLENE INSENSITIVE 3-like protein [Carex littledalei]|uniref:Protein ETHYLENE INSENSITIVE 3-like protein n=1 Tax=Carex littledalei TaxID=544730 RepID=A0A833R4V2_9POAL|nr:protein ETHYLENE INSENSITIVE 3-like protein [Carex littledalei]
MARSIQVRRKQIYLINDKILKCMLHIMESSNARGFVYGMVPENGKPLTGASDSLRRWWKEHAMFDKKAPAEVDPFYAENALMSSVSQRNEPMSTIEMLMELSDPTLGSILPVLMQNCSPKQCLFPLSKGVPPPWWPTGNDDWWGQTQIPREEGPPPYRKPHNLKKKWKAAVLLAVIKHLAPDFLSIYDIPHRYKYLVNRMSAKELKYWSMALTEEAKLFCSPAKPLEQKFPFLIRKCSYDPRPNVIISSGMVSAPGAFGQGHFSSTSSDLTARFVAPSGVGHELPAFAPSSSHYLAWPTTTPLISQSQKGVQMSSHPSGALMAPSGFFAPAGFAQQPPSYSFAPSSGIWATTMPMLGQDPQATGQLLRLVLGILIVECKCKINHTVIMLVAQVMCNCGISTFLCFLREQLSILFVSFFLYVYFK